MGTKHLDLTGQRFGALVAIKTIDVSEATRHPKWLCKCDCGGERTVVSNVLRNGSVKDCGCGAGNEIIGKRFGRLTVLEGAGTQKGHRMWKCRCDCGNITYVAGCNLSRTNRGQVSCGCYMTEKNTKHGMSGTRMERAFNAIKQRCFNPNHKAYEYYGGRGITICDEWLGENGFENFYKWAINNGYSDGLTIDRIDVNGNYCPENCRWVTMTEQMNNTRRNHFITIDGETHTVAQWCRIKGLKPGAYYGRISRGYTERDAIMTPPSPKTVKYSEDS